MSNATAQLLVPAPFALASLTFVVVAIRGYFDASLGAPKSRRRGPRLSR